MVLENVLKELDSLIRQLFDMHFTTNQVELIYMIDQLTELKRKIIGLPERSI